MLYVHRILMHMTGVSSLKFLRSHQMKAKANQLQRGVITYWIASLAIILVTRSLRFFFWVILEPMLCMTFFLALINVGFHGFIENDDKGVGIPSVNATTIIKGEDDFFGEDDHMAHHYYPNVYFRDLPKHQGSQEGVFKHTHASVFQKLSIVELSIFILLNLWDKCAEHYVDYTGTMSKEQIAEMLRIRAKRVETSYEAYTAYLANPTNDNRHAVAQSIQDSKKAE